MSDKTSTKEKLAPIVFALLGFLVVAFVVVYLPAREARAFSADGTVIRVDWDSPEKNYPLIRIREESGEKKDFSFRNISLARENIGSGDKFRKASGSKTCFINNVEIQCLE
jgi:hypothetical protein